MTEQQFYRGVSQKLYTPGGGGSILSGCTAYTESYDIVAANGYQQVPLDGTVRDTDGFWDGTGIEIPATGDYQISAQILLSTLPAAELDDFQFFICLNPEFSGGYLDDDNQAIAFAQQQRSTQGSGLDLSFSIPAFQCSLVAADELILAAGSERNATAYSTMNSSATLGINGRYLGTYLSVLRIG